ncbi:ECM14 [Nannizzia gypsea CBS 118893]|uniref:Inactive metallocarboxypeptidase ECM14 n=1 Tax=Arthroderma gypseum (strain ATCC MYA-4604 / CBS 118893) TaxID=535722 RepID=ECM14_ARTGP|nr:ECM14 [Nannizzia gypsea CBS 118893]E4UPZ6.1 RecName: Full=Inactive metallocarboxypeptidase ECM14; Flags: Precursor [Nannizzia gypsea CBS 118893]EFQ99130.1 ECM14 [Nannizzia gypsea CBS 118893]
MHFSVRLSLLLTLASSLPLVSAIPQHEDQAYTFPSPGRSATANTDPVLEVGRETQRTPSAWTRLRDSLVESVWGLPQRKEGGEWRTRNQVTTASRAPATLQARYGEDVVLRFTIKTQEEVKALVEASNILFLDVWGSHDDWVDIRLSRDVIPSLLGLLPPSLQSSHVPLIRDLAQTIYESYPKTNPSSPSQQGPTTRRFSPSASTSKTKPQETKNIFFQDYQPLSVLLPWMRLLVSMFSSHATLISVGTTAEGRDIPALRVGVHPTNNAQQAPRRRTIVISGGAHAREWISVSTVSYIAYSFITGYGKSRSITKLLEQFDYVFIPTVNPDGYAYTFSTDRLWRKNRQQTSLSFCPGIDLDHSWGYEWDGNATRSNPCSENYAGDQPFEAIEAREIATWARKEVTVNNVQFVAFVDLHSYSQQILYPYGHSCAHLPANLENLEELGAGLAKAIRKTSRENYDVKAACRGIVASSMGDKDADEAVTSSALESTAGSALDWFYHDMDVRFSYQIKLRDRGSYGFLLPREQIVPTGKEIYRAMVAMGKFLVSPHILTGDLNGPHAAEETQNYDDDFEEDEAEEDSDVFRAQGDDMSS